MRQYCILLFTVLTVTGITLLSGCTPDIAGATTETTNGVAGVAHNNDKTPAADVIVKLLPSGFNPMEATGTCAILIDTTDQKGEYRFSGLTAGTYNVLARKRDKVTSFLTRNVVVNDDSVTEVPAGVLRRSGSIIADFSQSEGAADGYVYIPGTDIVASVANNGGMVLGDVPYGTVDTLLFVSTGSEYNILRSVLEVNEDTTITIDQPLWRYGYRLVLNTSPSGADVAGDVFDFPLLVRLDKSTFSFAEADSGGEDLVFTGRKGNILPHEIERWDPVAQLAEVWVKIDTVYGNNATQFIMMYWGNPAAVPAAGGVVFDTADGFLGVWHLDDNGTDATQAENNASVCTPSDAEGIVGSGKKFNGKDSIKIATLLGKPQTVSLSAWARLDSTQADGGGEIVSIGDAALIRMDYDLNNIGTIGSMQLPGDSTYFNATSERYLKGTGWHFISFTVDQDSHTRSLYIDGVDVHTTTGNVADTINYTDAGQNTFIGIHGNGKSGFNFIGVIDEVRIYHTVLTADRLKLEYMNQITDGKLVVFED
jgi:hypothetical protein